MRCDRIHWELDGLTALGAFPPGIDEPTVLPDLLNVLRDYVDSFGDQIHLGLYEGITYLGPVGLAGPTVCRTRWLCEYIRANRTSQLNEPTGPLVALTERLYDELAAGCAPPNPLLHIGLLPGAHEQAVAFRYACRTRPNPATDRGFHRRM
jgi:hypothetical protein